MTPIVKYTTMTNTAAKFNQHKPAEAIRNQYKPR